MAHPQGYLQSFRAQQGKYLPIATEFMKEKHNLVEDYRPGKFELKSRNLLEAITPPDRYVLKEHQGEDADRPRKRARKALPTIWQ